MKKVTIYLATMAWAVTGFVMSSPRSAPSPRMELVGSGPQLHATQGNPNELKIAVTPPGCDDIGSILSSMGWAFTEIKESQLSDYNSLSQFDVVFINCSNTAYNVTDNEIGGLANFVSGGGTLYVSGLAYGYIQKTFPASYISFFDPPQSGAPGSVNAKIVDPGLASFLNSPTIPIEFKAPSWAPIQNVPDAVKVYLAGDFQLLDGTSYTNRPLAVSFAYSDGRVVYSSYFNEGQPTEEEKKLMNYLIFVTATRKLSAALNESILEKTSGHWAQQELLGSIGAGDTSPRFAFTNQSIIDLAVGLNWQAGTLRLSVFKPDGTLSTQQEGPPPLVIVVPNAEVGDWSYQVDAIDVAHDNYPYVVQLSIPGVVGAQPPSTPENLVGNAQATPSGFPANPAGNSATQGNQGPLVYVIIGIVLCLATLIAAGLIGAMIFIGRRRKA